MDVDRWKQFSFREQLGHITSELARAEHWDERGDLESRGRALERALELLDLSLDCHRGGRCRELARLREIVSGCLVQAGLYDVTLADLQRYGWAFVQATPD